MATFEERLMAVEHEQTGLKHDNEELKQKIELQTIAIGALVNKAAIERLNEKHDKLFEALTAHDAFIDHQLAELREKIEVDVEGRIAGMQTEMRHGFDVVNTRFGAIDTRFDALEGRFDVLEGRFDALEGRFETQDKRLDAQDKKLDQVLHLLTSLASKPDQEA